MERFVNGRPVGGVHVWAPLAMLLLASSGLASTVVAQAAEVFGGVAGTPAGGEESFLRYSGTATAQHTNRFLYRENHVVRYYDGKVAERVVLYTCDNGTAFARKIVSYADALAPDFVLEDTSNGMREGIRSAGSTREVFFRGAGADAEKSAGLRRVFGLVADSGFDEFVRMNWQRLMAGQKWGMRFLVPSRLEDMGFTVRRVGGSQWDGLAVEMFRLEVSGVLGWVAPHIDVYYGGKDHVLVRYLGLSDLRDASHENFPAQIAFAPGDRKSGGVQDMADARRVRLSPCRES